MIKAKTYKKKAKTCSEIKAEIYSENTYSEIFSSLKCQKKQAVTVVGAEQGKRLEQTTAKEVGNILINFETQSKKKWSNWHGMDRGTRWISKFVPFSLFFFCSVFSDCVFQFIGVQGGGVSSGPNF